MKNSCYKNICCGQPRYSSVVVLQFNNDAGRVLKLCIEGSVSLPHQREGLTTHRSESLHTSTLSFTFTTMETT